MANTKTGMPHYDVVLAKLVELTERAKQLTADAEELQAALLAQGMSLRARGTKRDVQSLVREPSVQDSPLYAQVRELLTARPLTLRELIETTAADENKVKVVLMRMQRDEIGLENMGNRYRALWFIPSESFRARMKAEKATNVG